MDNLSSPPIAPDQSLPEGQTQAIWQIQPTLSLPPEFVQWVQAYTAETSGQFAAQLLWQRGIQTEVDLHRFLDPAQYTPTPPSAFGTEMEWAVERVVQAYDRQEIVAIWGDFDADGITATAVLWEGLGQFFPPDRQLFYYIPNRLTESHGLSPAGLEQLAQQGCRLLITCDTGSTNEAELELAQTLGLEVIVTDHHTLLPHRPPVVAIVNPRSLPSNHPLAHLSGVAVAYKFLEALYDRLPQVPQQPLEDVLDLVAIGLIADLVELKGDCRYLAQRGIARLQELSQGSPRRPGITRLLELCQRSGDRPTDIAFGLGPRINAVSRIQGDAHFCVELLTSRDPDRCRRLAEIAETLNGRRKALQRDVVEQVKEKLAQLDLSTTRVIVLAEVGWPVGVLGLVAGQIAQEFGYPTILLTWEEAAETGGNGAAGPSRILARGSARSVNRIDLYGLVKGQEHLLTSFGGHPLAAGLSLPIENIPLFTEAINQQLRQQSLAGQFVPTLQADLTVTIADLGQDLFRELKILEPCGMGNPTPKLFLRNCWFDRTWNQNIRDYRGHKLRYIKTEFQLWDGTCTEGFPGVWWEHYREEIPPGRCDVIVELDFNPAAKPKRYELRLVAVRPCQAELPAAAPALDWILDWRDRATPLAEEPEPSPVPPIVVDQCPSRWSDLYPWVARSRLDQRPLAIAYAPPPPASPQDCWEQLIGLAKYLSRTHQGVSLAVLQQQLALSQPCLIKGLALLDQLGFQLQWPETAEGVLYIWGEPPNPLGQRSHFVALVEFLDAVQEDQFRQHYFYAMPLSTLQQMIAQLKI